MYWEVETFAEVYDRGYTHGIVGHMSGLKLNRMAVGKHGAERRSCPE